MKERTIRYCALLAAVIFPNLFTYFLDGLFGCGAGWVVGGWPEFFRTRSGLGVILVLEGFLSTLIKYYPVLLAAQQVVPLCFMRVVCVFLSVQFSVYFPHYLQPCLVHVQVTGCLSNHHCVLFN